MCSWGRGNVWGGAPWGGTVTVHAPSRAGPQGRLSRATTPTSLTFHGNLQTSHINNLLEGRTVFSGHIQVRWIQQALNQCTATLWLPGNIRLRMDSFRTRLSDLSGSKQILHPLSLLLEGSPEGERATPAPWSVPGCTRLSLKRLIFYGMQWQWQNTTFCLETKAFPCESHSRWIPFLPGSPRFW